MKTKLSAEQVRNNNAFIDRLLVVMTLKNDAALSRVLEVAPPVISKIRHGALSVGATLLISAHEESGLSIKEMKAVLEPQAMRVAA
ncbi:MAG: hypothetical protein Q7R66_18770 [Undibacterium sp.]|uniref:hypothetical protein n=1 Tax=Undibacterium sp. TaxID=1914977 RepID=UPI0027188F1A|nr:hypothetical protein [Undibacterium sp.]MDO8654219.1 hypothetical protein [Undibacterium sp.]